MLSRYLPVDEALLQACPLEDQVLQFARESFELIARSGVLELEPFERTAEEKEGPADPVVDEG